MGRRICTAFVALALIAAAAASAGGSAVLPGGKPTVRPTSARIDLATYQAKRWIVQLDGAPLATYRGGVAGFPATMAAATGASALNAASARSQAYIAHLQSAQRTFATRLTRAVAGARVERTYQAVLNGLAVDMSSKQAGVVRSMKGVRAVTPDIPYHLDMYATPAQIGAPVLWAQVGGQSKAGNGVRVAVIDSGIFVRKVGNTYAGNDCFKDAGYKAPGGYPKGDKRFTNNKVIVARAYFRPGDPPVAGENTPIQGTADGDSHGTHTAATIACDAGTGADFQGTHVTLSGIAPRAFLMNYRVFYPTPKDTSEDFQNGNAYTVELVKAIDDAVKDGAQVISNSWGASYQNTLAWPDPMVQAAERATAAGVTMVFAAGNAGPDEDSVNSPAISPKVIGVGAVSKSATIVPGTVGVTAPAPVPANLNGLDAGSADFGPQITTQTDAGPLVAAETVSTDPDSEAKTLGCSIGDDDSPFPAGSLDGDVVLIERGACDFSEKIFNAQRGGAVGALVYNSAANGDNLQSMAGGAHKGEVTIPSWFLRRSDGQHLATFAADNPGTGLARFFYTPHQAANVGDVMAGFSSRGPTTDKLIKPDVVAPGVDVLSAGYACEPDDNDPTVCPYPAAFMGFGSASGTSMATPHVAGAAALLKQLHPTWKPAQIKSALMTTATENVYLDTAKAKFAGVLDRGAGRIDLTKAGSPGLTLDQPSLSAGDLLPGQSVQFTIAATDVSASSRTWNVTTAKTAKTGQSPDSFSIDAPTKVTIASNHTVLLKVTLGAATGAPPGSYEGEVVLTQPQLNKQVHIPIWLRVIPQNPIADILLVDDDGSSIDPGFADYSTRYRALLDSLKVDYEYADPWNDGFPGLFDLYRYRLVIIFTGDNDSFDTSGLSPSDQDNLSEWLDSGGRLWVTGQNMAEETDSNGDFESTSLGRSRLYQGYLGLSEVADSGFDGSPPTPGGEGSGPMMTVPSQKPGFTTSTPLEVDFGPGGDGAANQDSVEVTRPMKDTDTYHAAGTMTRFFAPTGGDFADDPNLGIAWGRASEPTLEHEKPEFLYRSVSMGFGMEAVNGSTGFDRPKLVAGNTLDWLFDAITFACPDELEDGTICSGGISSKSHSKNKSTLHQTFNVGVASSSSAKWVKFRWDFGDKSKIVTIDKTRDPKNGEPRDPPPLWARTSATHEYSKNGTYTVRVEATDWLGHRAITRATVKVHS